MQHGGENQSRNSIFYATPRKCMYRTAFSAWNCRLSTANAYPTAIHSAHVQIKNNASLEECRKRQQEASNIRTINKGAIDCSEQLVYGKASLQKQKN